MKPPIHPLRRWLFEHQQTLAEFGSEIGASAGAVSEWLTGKKMPSWKAAERVSRATDGAITPNDFAAYCASVQHAPTDPAAIAAIQE